MFFSFIFESRDDGCAASRRVNKAVGDYKMPSFLLSLHLPDCVTLPPRIILSLTLLRCAERAWADDVIGRVNRNAVEGWAVPGTAAGRKEKEQMVGWLVCRLLGQQTELFPPHLYINSGACVRPSISALVFSLLHLSCFQERSISSVSLLRVCWV